MAGIAGLLLPGLSQEHRHIPRALRCINIRISLQGRKQDKLPGGREVLFLLQELGSKRARGEAVPEGIWEDALLAPVCLLSVITHGRK